MRRSVFLLIITVLCVITLTPATARAAVPPARRDLAEVKTVLSRAPKAPDARALRPLHILLIANRKDHGYHEHDYPRWLERWKTLLDGKGTGPVTMYGLTDDLPVGPKPGAARVTVETAADWPTAEQLRRADLMVAFMGTGGIWDAAKLRDLKTLLDRGAGFVALHSAVIAEKPHAQPLADLLGMAWEGGTTLFRHGPVDLKISAADNPITRGLPERIRFEDESYWPLVGDASRVTVLATTEEATPGTGKLAPVPMFWTHTVGKGRVFNSILGHYTWTFDDPYFRLLVLRGMAWAARESPYRFDTLALAGARTTDRKPEVAKVAPVTPAAPVAPKADDPNLLLWLDATDAKTLTVTPDGHVSAWVSKAARARLTADAAQQPLLVSDALGGRPAVRFDGADDVLRDTAFRQASGEWTVALVVTPRSNAGGFRALLAANRPGQDDFQTGFNIDLGAGETPTFNAVNLEGVKGGGATNLRTEATPFGGANVLILTVGNGSARLWVNGQAEEGRVVSDAATVMDELRLGGRFYMGQERGYFHGDVAEVLLYRHPISDAERAGLTAHLMKKYGTEIRPPSRVTLDPWDYLPAYDWGATRRPLTAIDEAVARAKADPRTRRELERRFIELLTDPANTLASRDFACRRLAIVGSAESVPALARMLSDPTLSPMACFALERIPGPEADDALGQAAATLTGKLRREAIAALSGRRSSAAAWNLATFMNDPDPATRTAVITALGNIGGMEAADALFNALNRNPEPLVAAALLQALERLETEGNREEKARIYERLRQPDIPAPTRRAAARSLVLMRGAEGIPLLIEQLSTNGPATQAMALLLLREMPDTKVTLAVASHLPQLSPEAQARTIGVLADRGDRAATAAIRAATRSDHPGVRLAALRALGRLGDVSDVPTLLAFATASDAEIGTAAKSSLATLADAGVDAALLQSAERLSVPERTAAVDVLGRRGYASANPVLIRAARGTEPGLRLAAIRALGETATVADLGVFIELLGSANALRESQAIEKALTTVYARTEERERWADTLLAGLVDAKPGKKAALLRALSLHGGIKVLQAVAAAVNEPDPELREEALNLLANWETPEAAGPLRLAAMTATSETHRTLALRGYLRIASLPSLDLTRRLRISRDGLEMAKRDDERRLALAALAGVAHLAALEVTLPYLERDGLIEEAGAAAVAIAQKLLPLYPAEVAAAMARVEKAVKSEDLKRQAVELRARAEAGRK